MVHCIDLHKYKDEILAKKNPDGIQDIKGDYPFENEDVRHEYSFRYPEITEALQKYKRVFLIVIPEFGYGGVYRSITGQSVSKLLKQAGDNADKQNTAICKTMAVKPDASETSTRDELIQILDDKKSDIPPTIVYSIGNILLNRMGIGIAEAGK